MNKKIFVGLGIVALMVLVPFSASALASDSNLQPAQSTDIVLGGLFPLTGKLAAGGVERDAAARMAVKEINADSTLLDGYTLKIEVRDTATDPTTGAAAASDLIDAGVVGLVGAASSGVSTAIQGVAKQKKIPQISYSSTSPTLSDKTEYPYFLRVVPPDSLQGVALANVVKELGLDNIATLATSDDYGLGGIEVFEENAEALGLTILTKQRFASQESNVLTQLNAIKDSGAKVIVLNAVVQDTITVFKQAADAGLVGDDYYWVGTDGSSQEQVFETAAETKEPMQGMIGTRPNVGSGEKYEAFLDLWESCYGEDNNTYAGCGDRNPNTFATFAYDAVYTFAHAIDKMIADGKDYKDGAALLEQLKVTDFVGATGRITFNEDLDRNGVYDVINLVGDTFEIVGSYDKATGLQLTGTIDWNGELDGNPVPDFGSETAAAPGFGWFMALSSIMVVAVIIRRRK